MPKEHGAYGQLAFPIVSALVAGRATVAAIALTIAAAAAFAVHEPLLVLLGQRGTRARREDGARAARVSSILLTVGIVAAAAGLTLAPSQARLLALVAVAPAAVCVVLVLARRERTLLGELAAIAAFTSSSLPIAAAAGLTSDAAASLAAVWAVGFGTATIVVRGVIAHARGEDGARLAGRAALVVAVLAMVAAWGLFTRSSPWLVAAFAPLGVASLTLACFPPSVRRVRGVGWTLVATSVLTFALVVTATR